MTDDLVNAEDLAERKKQRESAATATDDGMPVGPENKAGDVEAIQYITPKKMGEKHKEVARSSGCRYAIGTAVEREAQG